jgi:hypothetical protein
MTIKQTSFCTFSLDFKNGSVVINPVKKSESDIVIFTNENSGYLNYEADAHLKIKNAGEFEVKDIFVHGSKNKGENSYTFTVSGDEITVGVIGFGTDLNNFDIDLFESCDVLLIGAGSGPFLSPINAHNLANRIAPSVAIFYGFKDQASQTKEVAQILDSLDEGKKEITALQLSEKSMKIDKDYVDGLENTVNFYFEV